MAGHSMGGAIARLVARRLIEEGLEVAELTTWGEPSSGCREFVKNDVEPSTRYVLSRDPVPNLWPWFYHGLKAVKLEPNQPYMCGQIVHKLKVYKNARY